MVGRKGGWAGRAVVGREGGNGWKDGAGFGGWWVVRVVVHRKGMEGTQSREVSSG